MRKFFSLIAAVLFAGSMMADNFVLVTDASTLADGDQIIITNAVPDRAISTTQNNNNRGVATVSETEGVIVPGEDVQIITLVAADANFMLQVGDDAYLYAASNSSNHLKTATAATAGDNGKFAIAIDAEGIASVIAQGTNARNDLRYNPSGMFSCYASTTSVEAGLKIFKKEGGSVVPPTPADTYTVAGNDAAIFGEAWNPALTTNDMTLANGVYTWTKANLNLTVGSIEFKVVKNHSWDVAYPAQNYVLNIAEDGEYTITITFDPATEAVAAEAVKKVIPQYEVAEAIAAGLTENDEIFVHGIITKMEFKGKNFAKYGSVNIYVADATGAEGVFEFYNCYSLNADTFRTSTPAYDAESTAWVEFDEVADENGNAIHVGDTVIAFGKYQLYNTTHELKTGCYLTEIKHPGDAPVEEDNVIYDWAGEIGTTILGASGVEVSTVKIHTNTDAVPAIKFGSSFVYADGKWIAIKPAEGGFQAGDVLSVAAVFNNADDTKYAQIDLRAADGDTRIWLSDSASTINGRTQAGEPIVQTYTLEADQDSLFLGRYGNTGMFVTLINVVRGGEVVPPTPEHTYTVAGSDATLFGTAWTPSLEANDMTLVEGVYTWEKAELELPAGTIEFKVCEDHAWTVAYPAQNYQLTIPEAGIYTITITFNAETKEVAAVAQKTGDAVVIPTIAMHGNFLGSWADTENFAIAEGNETASLTLNVEAGNYEFGMRIGGSGNWTANGAAFTRENNAAEIVAGQGNLKLAADVAGEYIFTWTYATNTLAITYPEAPVVADTIVIDIESEVEYVDYVAAQGWWQFMAKNETYDISISNVSTTQAAGVYGVADLDVDYTYVKVLATQEKIHFVDGELTLTEGADGSRTIEGVMTGEDGNIYNIKLVYVIPTAENVVNVEIPEWGIVQDYYGYTGYTFYGETADENIYVQLTILGSNPLGQFTYDDCYMGGTGIQVGEDYKGIYSMNITVTAGGTAGAERAFITADILCYNNTLYHVTTLVGEGVDAIEAAEKAVKMIQNGNVVIIKNGVHYNVNGQVIK